MSDRPGQKNLDVRVSGADFTPSPPSGPPLPSAEVSNADFRSPSTGQMESVGSHGAQIVNTAVIGEYVYAVLGLVLGLHSTLSDAAPGAVLFIVGIFIVFITRPKVKLEDIKG